MDEEVSIRRSGGHSGAKSSLENQGWMAKLYFFAGRMMNMIMPVGVLEKIKCSIVCFKDGERTEYLTFEDFEDNCGEYDDVASISAEDGKIVIEIMDREKEIYDNHEAFLKKWEEKYGSWSSPYGY